VSFTAIHHKSVGLQGGHRDLFMIDGIGNTWPGPEDRRGSESSEEFRRVQSC
jgi:hypothetical protein